MSAPTRYEDPGFTPPRTEVDACIEELLNAEEEQVPAIERALGRAGLLAAERATARLPEADPSARVRLVRLIARVTREHTEPTLVSELCSRLSDSDEHVQRAAIIGLGKLRHSGIEEALLEYAARNPAPPEYRVLVEALGKVGGARAAEWLSEQSSSDEFTTRLLERARLMLARTETRPETTEPVRLDVELAQARTLLLECREGLEPIVSEQIRALGTAVVSPGRVRLTNFTGALSAALVARSALSFGIELDLDRQLSIIDAVIVALNHSGILPWMQQSSGNVPRVRLEFLGQGHQRAAVWDLQTRLVSEHTPLVADPTSASWDIQVDWAEGKLAIIPKSFNDPRFAWRVAQLPSASNPTIAAALAHVAGVLPDDVVWDPFVGSGLELIERAILGPYRAMYGTDTDERALAAAQANIKAASVKHVTLLGRDATTAPVRDISLVITNPPLGARLVRDGSLGDLLEATLRHGWNVLRPGGRWVWLSPMPARTASIAHFLGFNLERRGLIDVGGLRPELQIFRVPTRETSSARPAAPQPERRRKIVR